MATSIRDLLQQIQQRTTPAPATVAQGEASTALAALQPLGRALNTLLADGLDTDPAPPRAAAVRDLAAASQHASPHWRPPAGPLADLAAAIADLTVVLQDRFGTAERWSAAVAIADAAQRCVAYARHHPGYHDAPLYRRIHSAAATVAQHAAADPPNPLRRTLLDQQFPNPAVTGGHLAHAAEAAPALTLAVRHAVHHGGLTLADVLTTLAAAHTAAHYASLLAAALTQPRAAAAETAAPWREATRAWQHTHRQLNPFDDGTRARHPAAADLAHAAGQLHHALRAHLGPDATPDTVRRHHDLPALATAQRQIANHLPDLADDLTRAIVTWGATGQLAALATNLPHSGRSLDAHLRHRIVTADLDDLAATLAALRRAHTLSVQLAGELDRSAEHVGVQPQPHLAVSYRIRQAGTAGPDAAAQVAAAATTPPRLPTPWQLPPPTRARAR